MRIKLISLFGLFVLVISQQPLAHAQEAARHEASIAAMRAPSRTSSIVSTDAAPASGCSVSSLVGEYGNWLNHNPQGGTNVVHVVAVSNQKNGLASYAEGDLKITVAPFPSGAGQPPPTGPYTLGGTLTQYFSDRKFGMPQPGGLSINQYPFSPKKTDQLGLSVSTGGAASLTLKSWGNTNINLVGVDCAGGVLYGLTGTNPMQSFYVISLTKDFQANLPQVK